MNKDKEYAQTLAREYRETLRNCIAARVAGRDPYTKDYRIWLTMEYHDSTRLIEAVMYSREKTRRKYYKALLELIQEVKEEETAEQTVLYILDRDGE